LPVEVMRFVNVRRDASAERRDGCAVRRKALEGTTP
jgi:hypothetical protein